MPGSGKTSYMQELLDDGKIDVFFDDFQAKAPEKDKNPRLSRHYGQAVKDLRLGKTIAVSDIRYCIRSELNNLISAVIDAVPDIEIDIRYFENDPEKCIKNVHKRARKDRIEIELKLIQEYTATYKVPTHTNSILKIH